MKPTVLIIEDDSTLNRLMVKVLSGNFDVISKMDGKDAVKWLKSTKSVDAIVTDLNLPNFDGMEIIKTIRKNSSTKKTPIIVLTNNDDEKVQKESLKHGANAYFNKPFDFELLVNKIQELL